MNIRLTSLFVSLFLSVPVWAGGHKNLPAKGDLHIPVFENEGYLIYNIDSE